MSLPSWNITRHRSHSCREKTTRAPRELHRQEIERIQRRYEQELSKSQRDLQWAINQRNDSSLAREYIKNLRVKLKNDYNQLVQEQVEEIEQYMNQRYNEERRLYQRKLRKTQMENEKFRKEIVNQIVREQGAICDEKLAVQRSLYNRLLDEQAGRLRAEQNLQSFESLNIEQLKDRLARVEHSNYELQQVIHDLIINQKPIYRSAVYIPNFALISPVFVFQIMSISSSTIKNKKKHISQVTKSNHIENIKPIEVKCFLDENKITIETEKQQADITATMMTIIPQVKRLTASAPSKKRTVTAVTDMVISKPIRHLAILPSAKEQLKKEITKRATNLSETFTMYDGPTTTPIVGRSIDETLTMNSQIPINIELTTNNTNLCDNTTLSSVCELVDQTKLHQKPHSLIGRYQLSNVDTSSKSNPTVHLATVHYDEIQPPELTNKQILIQQFYAQLEKMKATFDTEQSHQITTNTFTFDNGQVRQTSAMNQLKEKTTVTRVSSATVRPNNNMKPSIPKKQTTRKNPSSRVQSAPIIMATQSSNNDRNYQRTSSCKQRRNEKTSIQEKKPPHTKDKQKRNIESAPPVNIDIHGPEVTLLPNDEQECQQMYEKLQRLQPDGVCVDLNTLRRALYPPVGNASYSSNHNNHDQTSSASKSYRQRTEEIPQSWMNLDDKYVISYVPKQQNKTQIKSDESNLIIASDNTNIDRIADQVKKHAAINYSYYTRTK
ncbi:unnamed protein product [Rotaria sp. Silwood2]|nr:unnamed protein product [Rotaria sp. Silwood2]CAF2797102.1 unnamed protein product [Rotaria sp. Silwood2]CAF3199829.1 unnamed protein product [Rotaria sp. Silwood2]CAF3949534.1 unnamed protein product [Rotaria sp. Silwood2]CAF3971594.1 unnamed protein product [Rotaria sp. Silwood2]